MIFLKFNLFMMGLMLAITILGFIIDPIIRNAKALGVLVVFGVLATIMAISVGIVRFFVSNPSVTLDWLYWLFSVGWITMLVSGFAMPERCRAQTPKQVQLVLQGINMFSFISLIVYAVFVFFPVLHGRLFNWILSPLGLPA